MAQVKAILRINGRYLRWLNLSGGEPFLRGDFPEILRSAVRHCRDLQVLTINTNGYLTNVIRNCIKEVMREPSDARVIVIVSLETSPERALMRTGVAEAYERSRRTIVELTQMRRMYRRLEVRGELLVGWDNIADFSQQLLSDQLRSLRKVITFAQESSTYRNEGSGVSLDGVCPQIVSTAIMELLANCRGGGLEDLVLRIVYALTPHYYARSRGQILPCYAGWSSVVVGPSGDIRPCIIRPPWTNLKDCGFDIRRALASDEAQGMRQEIRREQCRCWTPCEAVSAILQSLPLSLWRYRGARQKLFKRYHKADDSVGLLRVSPDISRRG